MSIDERFSDKLNFRDLGGLECEDGRKVRHGFFYRGAGLAYFDRQELAEFAKLKIRTIMDLRSKDEAERIPDPDVEGSEYIRHSGLVVKGSEDIDWSPAGMRQISGAAYEQLRKIGGYYRTIPFDNEAYRILMNLIAEKKVPVYFHCMTGKDRTGMAALVILLALGVKEAEIRKDYLLSNEFRREILQKSLDEVSAVIKDHPEMAELITIMDGVREETLNIVENAILEKYGTYETYLEKEYGLNEEIRAELRDYYLE